MPGKIEKITKNTAKTHIKVYYDDGSTQIITVDEAKTTPEKWKVGVTLNDAGDIVKPKKTPTGSDKGGDNQQYTVRDTPLKEAAVQAGFQHIEADPKYRWSEEMVGSQRPSANPSEWVWDESGFIRPKNLEYGQGALDDFKRRHGTKINADYEGGWDQWVKDMQADHSNNNKAVRWLVGELNKKSQELVGKDYVDPTQKGAFIPGVEIFNLPGIWDAQPEETVEETFTVGPCPEGYEKNDAGECVPIQKEEMCPEGYVKNPITGECEPVQEPFKDEYRERDMPWLPDQYNVLGAMTDRIYKGYPQLEQIDLEPGSVALRTPDRMIAAEKEGQQKIIDMIESSTPMQQGVSAAITGLGDSIERTANYIDTVEGANTGIMNEYSQYAAGIENQEEQYNKAALKRYIDEVNAFNQNLSDEKDLKDAQTLAATNRMLGNWYKKKWSEKVLFPQAYVDPLTGDPYWTGKGRDPMDPYDTYTPAYGGTGQSASLEARASAVQKAMSDYGLSEEGAIDLVNNQYRAPRRTGQGNQFGYDPYSIMDFEGGSGQKRRVKQGGSIPFGVYLQGGIFE